MFCQHDSCFSRCHQAGVEANEVKGNIRIGQSSIDISQSHRIDIRIFLVIAVTADRTSAVIPHDQSITVCREIVGTVFDKAGKVIRIQHRTCSGIFDQIADLTVAGDLDDLIVFAGNDISIPLCRTTGKDDDVYFIRYCSAGHFDQVVDGHTIL